MKLKYIVILTSLIIAGCAAFFSVYGIGLLFSGALLSTTIMASSLELGKLVSASWLFNNWKIANKLMKTYLILAILVLMGITSVGIFGYLTAAHQKSALESELAENKIKGLTEQKSTELLNIEAVNKNIDRYIELRKAQEDRLATSMTNTVIARNPMQLQQIQEQIDEQIKGLNAQIEAENVKLKSYNDKISRIDEEVFELKISNANKKDITTFQFVAEEFNTDIRTVVKWFIIVLITVFDPLAVVLLLAFNITNKEEKPQNYSNKIENNEDIEDEKKKKVKTQSNIPINLNDINNIDQLSSSIANLSKNEMTFYDVNDDNFEDSDNIRTRRLRNRRKSQLNEQNYYNIDNKQLEISEKSINNNINSEVEIKDGNISDNSSDQNNITNITELPTDNKKSLQKIVKTVY